MTYAMSSYPIPYVVQSTPRGERTLDLYSRLGNSALKAQ